MFFILLTGGLTDRWRGVSGTGPSRFFLRILLGDVGAIESFYQSIIYFK